mmetsp:Transcript_15363/g.17097  ORF Transcript_15363/g.17097 Transcript_15363/m.17097 type:complete len:146 (+) Transcript_15363:68-505(+)
MQEASTLAPSELRLSVGVIIGIIFGILAVFGGIFVSLAVCCVKAKRSSTVKDKEIKDEDYLGDLSRSPTKSPRNTIEGRDTRDTRAYIDTGKKGKKEKRVPSADYVAPTAVPVLRDPKASAYGPSPIVPHKTSSEEGDESDDNGS